MAGKSVVHKPKQGAAEAALPDLTAGIDRVTRKEIRHFGIGGLCMRCEVCRYPICPFQK